jgi:hypothetical protein
MTKKSIFLLLFYSLILSFIYSQNNYSPGPPNGYIAVPPMGFRTIEVWTHPDFQYFYEFTLEEKLEWYFDRFRYLSMIPSPDSGRSGYIVMEHGPEIIPYLRRYLIEANFFQHLENPRNNTLFLISYLFRALHDYSNPVYHDMVKPFVIDENDIKWFIDQYKILIDEYIMSTRRIDRVVRDSEYCIQSIAGRNSQRNEWDYEKYGHHMDFFGKGYNIEEALKNYYEERLGISNLVIVDLSEYPSS